MGTSAPLWRAQSSASDELVEEERLRIRNYSSFCVVLLAGTMASLGLVGGDPTAKLIHFLSLGCSLIGAVHTVFHAWKRSSEPKRWLSNALGFVTIPGLVSGYYFWGDVSPASTVVPFGIIVFGLSQSFVGALIVWLLCAVPLLALSVLIAAGIIDDRSLLSVQGLSAFERLAVAALAQFIFAASFFITRQMRRASLATVANLQAVTRSVAMREALLGEAQLRLQEVAKLGGPGIYSERTLGRFKLGVVIGRGAMGEVYDAYAKEGEQRAAVKVLSHVATNPDNIRRFTREAKISSSLASQHVVAVLQVSSPEDLVPFIAMERLEGETLRDYLSAKPGMQAEEAVELIRQVARGLECAHRAGIIHRDLKPANIFRHAADGAAVVWKVLDFGISTLEDNSGTMTHGGIVGTPTYMPPEQAKGLRVGTTADVYSLAAVAYRCLTGRPPFSGDRPSSVLYNVVHTMPPRPSAQEGVAPAFDIALAIGMAKKASDRFQDVGEFAQAMHDAASDSLSNDLIARGHRLQTSYAWGAARVMAPGPTDEPGGREARRRRLPRHLGKQIPRVTD